MAESDTAQDLAESRTDKGSAKTIYILYLIGIVVGITSIVGVIMAYMNRGDAPQWLATHYQWQIRTFWIGLLFGIVSALLTVVIIGFLLALLALIWYIVRCAKGIQALDKSEAIENPTSWMFG